MSSDTCTKSTSGSVRATRSSNLKASSAVSLPTAIILARGLDAARSLASCELQTSTRGSQCAIFDCSSEEKLSLSTTSAAPALTAPEHAMNSSGELLSATATRSPGFTSSPSSAAANRREHACSSALVQERSANTSPISLGKRLACSNSHRATLIGNSAPRPRCTVRRLKESTCVQRLVAFHLATN